MFRRLAALGFLDQRLEEGLRRVMVSVEDWN